MDKKVLLQVNDLHVKFHVRGRVLTAIRGISLDIYEDESIAIVGESGSGKSVFTKTFAGMLDANGFIDSGSVIFNDDELSDTTVLLNGFARSSIERAEKKLNEYSKLELGAQIYKQLLQLESEKRSRDTLSDEEAAKYDATLKELNYQRVETSNQLQTIDSKHDKATYQQLKSELASLNAQIKQAEAQRVSDIKAHHEKIKSDEAYLAEYEKQHAALKAQYQDAVSKEISDGTRKRNEILAKEIYLSVGRYPLRRRIKLINALLKALKKAMQLGVDLSDDLARNRVFDDVAFRVRYLDETPEKLHGTCYVNLAKINNPGDWSKVRGKKIATVFQDPMTSLNPIITIGKQITSIILKHQNCSEAEARQRALILMKKVGIPKAEQRFDDYPFQYSGGMRQRIVIAIALSCQPKILICDEPTTALDVTIQAQILKLLKDLQKEFHYSIVFITHDLGVVANIADRVAVMYAGQIVEIGDVEEVFYDPRHPYTWALMSSMPQLAEKNTELYSITGTPPSLYNKIVGDPFAPRNPYCLKIDTIEDPPMFKVSDTHYAKTCLLDPRAPKMEKPEAIRDIHEKLIRAFNI